MIFENIKKNHITIYLILFFLSLILGVAITEILTLFFFIFFLNNKNKTLINFNFDWFQKLFLILVVYICLNFIVNTILFDYKLDYIRSLLYGRFFILFLIISNFVNSKILNKVLKFWSIILIFLCADLIFQYIVGFNILGFETIGGRVSSFFLDELKAGSFLTKFGIPICFYCYLVFKKKFGIKIFYIFALYLFISIYLTGERMALVTFFITLFISFLIVKGFKKNIIIILLPFVIFFFGLIKINENNRWNSHSLLEKREQSFYELNGIKKINSFDEKIDKFYTILDSSGHLPLFFTSFNLWNERKIIGHGLKSFRELCDKKSSKIKFKYNTCSTHPHNYYFETLSELGLVGLLILISLFTVVIKDYFKINKNHKFKNNEFDSIMLKALFANFLGTILIISSGSFFNNWISYSFWINISLYYSIIYKYSYIKNKTHE